MDNITESVIKILINDSFKFNNIELADDSISVLIESVGISDPILYINENGVLSVFKENPKYDASGNLVISYKFRTEKYVNLDLGIFEGLDVSEYSIDKISLLNGIPKCRLVNEHTDIYDLSKDYKDKCNYIFESLKNILEIVEYKKTQINESVSNRNIIREFINNELA